VDVQNLPAGNYYLLVDVDSFNVLNDGAFVAASATTIAWQTPQRDLAGALDTSKYPLQVKPGDKKLGRLKKVPVQLTNFETADVSGAVTFDLYASADQVLDGADVLLTSMVKNIFVRAGGLKKISFSKIVVPVLPVGNYYLIVDIDSANVITEVNEANNAAVSGITIQWLA